ncbi:MAG: hypothetical protein AAFX55_02160 [Bacteroidota bacterium]
MRIDEVILYTSQIEAQKFFYRSTLGLEQLLDSPNEISFKVGYSVLTFRYKKMMKPSHLAFNIPAGSILKAKIWLEKRTALIQSGENYIADFDSWRAKSIYFYDADGNIMEFIAREAISANLEGEFSSRSLVSISELGIVTNDIETIYNSINTIKPIRIFDGDFSRFCALGNDDGLFIVIDKAKKKWYPTNEEAFTSEFSIRGDYNFTFEKGRIKT